MALFSSDKSVEMKPIGSSDTIEGLISSLGRKVDEPLELSNTLLEK